MAQWLKRWGWWALLLVAGVGMRLLFLHWRPGVAGDSLLYGDLAQNIVSHHVYGFTEASAIRPTLIRMPGYPGFLAACFALFGAGNFLAAVRVQLVIDVAGWWMLARLAERLLGKRVGLAALGLGMLCPFLANYCVVPLTETLVMFCAIVAMVGMERWMAWGGGWNRWLCVVGGALVYGVFLRPDQALMAVAVVVAMAWVAWRSTGVPGLRPLIAMCVVMAVPFVLWGVRNWKVFHVVQPLAPRLANDPGETEPVGFYRWYRTWAIDFKATNDVYWNWDGSPVDIGDVSQRAFDSALQREETVGLYAEYARTEKSTPELDAKMRTLANERIRENPLRYYVWVPALKVANMWLRPRTEFMALPLDWWNFRAHELGSWEAFGFAVWNGAYLVLAVRGFVVWKRRGWDVMLGMMVGFVLLRCVLLWTIDNSEPRYTLECFPMVVLLGAVVFAGRVRDVAVE